jgi:hypothetical protein
MVVLQVGPALHEVVCAFVSFCSKIRAVRGLSHQRSSAQSAVKPGVRVRARKQCSAACNFRRRVCSAEVGQGLGPAFGHRSRLTLCAETMRGLAGSVSSKPTLGRSKTTPYFPNGDSPINRRAMAGLPPPPCQRSVTSVLHGSKILLCCEESKCELGGNFGELVDRGVACREYRGDYSAARFGEHPAMGAGDFFD